MRNLMVAAFLLFGASTCLANDTMVLLGAGGLVPLKTTSVSMQSEDLEISTKQIHVHYIFLNSSAKDVRAMIGFPLPQLNGVTLAVSPIELPNPKADNFVDFAVTANGKPVVAKLELRAFQDKKDVTEELQRYGLTASLLSVKDTFAKLPPTQKADLVKKGLVFGEDGPDPNAGAWNMQATYYWTQLFPAHSTVDVVHTYKPVVGGSYVVESGDSKQNREWWEGIVGDYCGGPGSVRKIEAVEHTLKPVTGDTFMFEHQVQYILRTANNWNGPIGKFHLTIRTNNPEDVLATCFPDLRKTSPTTYEATRKNFSPSSDLDLNILQHDR